LEEKIDFDSEILLEFKSSKKIEKQFHKIHLEISFFVSNVVT